VIPTPVIFSNRTEGMAARMFEDMVYIEVCVHVFEEETKRREDNNCSKSEFYDIATVGTGPSLPRVKFVEFQS
jgi:hypothetical protein